MMANQGSSSPAYQRICSPTTNHYDNGNETKLFIIIDSRAPVILKAPEAPGRLTLGRFKHYASLQDNCYKFYFQSHDSEFGTVKEELVEDDAVLPIVEGRIVAWVVSDSSAHSANLFEPPAESLSFNRATGNINRSNERFAPYYLKNLSQKTTISHQDQALSPPPPPKISHMSHPRVPPRPPMRSSPMAGVRQQIVESKIGFDPATELPAPMLEPSQIQAFTFENTETTNNRSPVVNFHRFTNNQEHQRASHSLPRSLTPRSLYASGNLENTGFQIDSRSDYEPTTPTSLRSNLYQVPLHCLKDDVNVIFEALKADAQSLDVRDREWLKVVIKDAFLGSAFVKWLSVNVYGFCNKRDVKRYANKMLTLGFIKSPISKASFSEKCLYTFG